MISTESIGQKLKTTEACQILLYKLFQIYSAPVQPLFVFDGKDRPSVKRGKASDKSRPIVNEEVFRVMLEAFGFDAWTVRVLLCPDFSSGSMIG